MSIQRSAMLLTFLAAAGLMAACGGGNGDGSAAVEALSGARVRALAAGNAANGGVMINEVHTANWHGATDEDGDAEDWVELYNPAAVAVDLSGYGLSHKTASPFLWTFPAGTRLDARAYLRVWLSKKNRTAVGQDLHASFNLDNGADPLLLSASNATAAGILVDSVTPPLVKPDHSWCRQPSGGAAAPFQICAAPTPAAANAGPAYATMLARPTMSLPSGLYASAQTVSLAGPAGATIRYTLDGSEPVASSPAYAAPITVSAGLSLRAVAFADGALSSPVETASYVIDAALAGKYASLKAVFVTMAPADLTRFQARDKALSAYTAVEMLASGTRLFKLDADGSVAGQGGSLDAPQVAINLNARDALGFKSFPAALWPDKPAIKATKKIRLRNGSNDWAAAHLRDQFSQSLGAAGPNLIAASTAVAMFLNGRYYALMDLREREDETFVADNLGVDKDNVDFLSDPLLSGQEIKNGGAAALGAYQTVHDSLVGSDLSVAANYARAATLIDPASLAWDWGIHLFHANYDWPWHNVHVYRTPETDGRWTWHAHDMDFAFGRYVGPEFNMNFAYTDAGSEVFMSLMRNTGFRTLFFNTLADQMNLMTPTMMNARLDAMVADMRPYVADYYAANNMGTEATWTGEINRIRSWIKVREGFHDTHLRAQFGLGNRGAIGVTVNDAAMGTVKVNSLDVGAQMPVGTPAWSGRYYPSVPLTLEAKPKPGFTFVGWQGASSATTRRITHTVSAGPVNADGFSARWTGQLKAPVAGSYRFQTVSDDGVRVRLAGQSLIDRWTTHTEATDTSAPVVLQAGQRVDLSVDYFDAGGTATLRLLWLPPGQIEYVPVPTSQLYPDAVSTLPTGLSASYFNNTALTGTAVAQAIEGIDFNWGTAAPTPSAAQFRAVFAAAGAPAAPILAALPAQSARTGDTVNLRVSATDPGGFDLSYSAKTLPKGLSINALTGTIYGRLTTPGSYASTISASNGVSTGSLTVSWTVADRPGTGLLGTSADSGTPPPPPPVLNVAPVVRMSSPAAALGVANGSTLTLAAAASDPDGSIARVDFYDGGTRLASVTTAPYQLSWTATLGIHNITARAFDNRGANTLSSFVGITVIDQAPTSLPAGAIACAGERGTCVVPAGVTATVYYGANTTYVAKTGQTGGVACTSANFGNPIAGVSKRCFYVATTGGGGGGNTGGTGATGLTAEFWANTAFTGAPVLSRIEQPGMNLSGGAGPGAGLPTSRFAARWSGQLTPTATGTYTLRTITSVDDGVRLWVNNQLLIDNWSAPVTAKEATVTLTAGQAVPIRLEFFDAAAEAVLSLGWKTPGASSFVAVPAFLFSTGSGGGGTGVSGTGLTGQYFGSVDLAGTALLTRTEGIGFDWGDGSPGGAVPADFFSARWTGALLVPTTGSYTFQTVSDDGVRVWVNNQLLIDNWTPHGPTVDTSAALTLTAGQRVAVKVEYQEFSGGAVVQWLWKPPGSAVHSVVPLSALFAN